jgi:hypothetical protein
MCNRLPSIHDPMSVTISGPILKLELNNAIPQGTTKVLTIKNIKGTMETTQILIFYKITLASLFLNNFTE